MSFFWKFLCSNVLAVLMVTACPGCTMVKTIAGDGTPGCSDGPGLSARFNQPSGVLTDPWVNIYVADAGCHQVRQIVHGAGNVTTFAGTGSFGCQNGNVLKQAQFNYPVDIARDPGGNYFVADRNNHTIRKITAAGMVSTLAGVCQKAIGPTECQPHVKPCNVNVTVPEVATVDPANDDIPQALFNRPSAVVVDGSGNVLVADYGTCSVRKIDPHGTVTTIGKKDGTKIPSIVHCCTCRGPFQHPAGIDTDAAGNIYVSEFWGHRISKIDIATENVTTIAGTSFGFRDGPGAEAKFYHPYHISVDKLTGDIYVADLGNSKIRKIANDAVHTVSTFAGTGVSGFHDGKAADAEFNHPRGIEYVKKLLLYIGDTYNHRVREIDP
jgi:DNA-binding beta-propeller fold protein YncE